MMTMLWRMVMGDPRTADERKADILNSIARHGTPRTFRVSTGATPLTVDYHGFLVFPAPANKWLATSGNFPDAGRTELYTQKDIADWVGENLITDGNVLDAARRRIDGNGYAEANFYDPFTSDECVLVYIHSTHFKKNFVVGKDGKLYLSEPINKTRDPYVVFDPMCQIAKPEPPSTALEYAILEPMPSVLFEAYNKETKRLGLN